MMQKYTHWQSFLLLVGRLAFVTMFFVAGYGVVLKFHHFAHVLSRKGIPWSTFFLTVGSIAEFCGAILVLIGWYTRLGAWLLLAFTIAITLIFHSFLQFIDLSMLTNRAQFFLNLSIAGGTLFLIVTGAGRYSVDNLRRK